VVLAAEMGAHNIKKFIILQYPNVKKARRCFIQIWVAEVSQRPDGGTTTSANNRICATEQLES